MHADAAQFGREDALPADGSAFTNARVRVVCFFQKSRWLLLCLRRKKPCPEFLLTHVSPAAPEMHRKWPTVSACPDRSTLGSLHEKGRSSRSTDATPVTATVQRRERCRSTSQLPGHLLRFR